MIMHSGPVPGAAGAGPARPGPGRRPAELRPAGSGYSLPKAASSAFSASVSSRGASPLAIFADWT